MKRSIKLTSINGMAIKMHWTFLILLVWVIAANAVNGLTFDKIAWSLVFIVLVMSSILKSHNTVQKVMGNKLQSSQTVYSFRGR